MSGVVRTHGNAGPPVASPRAACGRSVWGCSGAGGSAARGGNTPVQIRPGELADTAAGGPRNRVSLTESKRGDGLRRGRRGARLTRRVREEYRVYFDRSATMSGAQRRGSGGMDRRPNAAWVSSPAVWPGWIAGRTPRGFHHRLFGRDGSPGERRVGFTTGCSGGMDRRPNAAWVPPPAVWPGWIAGRTPRGFHYRLFGRDGSPAERRAGFTTGW